MQDLKVSLIQSDIAWEDKQANYDQFEKLFEQVDGDSHLVILPEMFNTGFSMNKNLAETMNGPCLDWMKAQSSKMKKVICGSAIILDEGNIRNRFLWIRPDGTLSFYDKRHLFSLGNEHLHFTAGEDRLLVDLNGWKIMPQICYDLRFPSFAANEYNEGEFKYDMLLFVASWPEKRINAWKALLKARAIENQCYSIGVSRVGLDGEGINHTGDSCVYDPMGEELFNKANEEVVANVLLSEFDLRATRRKLPFLKDADKIKIL